MPDGANTVVVKDGRILEVGSDDLVSKYESKETVDLEGAFLMPGWIEGHGHFSGIGRSLQNLNLLKSKSWEQIVGQVKEKVDQAKPGQWIQGRGWHQEKWTSTPDENYHGYPTHKELSAISPDNPIILGHASGHGLFANAKAMELAGVTRETPDPSGGAIIRDENGDPIGVFEERAMSIISDAFSQYQNTLPPEQREEQWYEAIELAEEECLSKGITSFQDAGTYFSDIPKYKKLAKEGNLDVRYWGMIRHSADQMRGKLQDLKLVDYGNGYLTLNAIKSEVDGALGAFGAWLIKPYSDKDGFHGQNTTSIQDVKAIAELAMENDMQICVHAIGDRANRVIVDMYEHMLGEVPNGKDRRWRIEHAQHLDPADIPRFATSGIIASMQGIHCTSDAPFVQDRLGLDRAKDGAYAWRSLLDAGVKIANGTDAPVEDVDPIPSFYASVTRKRADSGFEFFPEQSMTREEALRSYTLDNAYAAFEEDKKGSIEVGKYADFAVMDTDLVNCKEEDILDTKVLYTIVDGKIKYKRD